MVDLVLQAAAQKTVRFHPKRLTVLRHTLDDDARVALDHPGDSRDDEPDELTVVSGTPFNGGEHLIVTDTEGVRRIDVTGDPLPWAEDLLADLADDGERLFTQEHVLGVCDLALQAQERAVPWGAP